MLFNIQTPGDEVGVCKCKNADQVSLLLLDYRAIYAISHCEIKSHRIQPHLKANSLKNF